MKACKFKLIVEGLSLCPKKGVLSYPCQAIEASLEGLIGDRHFGFTKKADGRDSGIIRGTIVRNWRQWSAVSVEELKQIANNMALENISPEHLGSNITFSGMENFTSIPRGATLWFPQGAILAVEDENTPCVHAGKEIAKHHVPGLIEPAQFVKAALGIRGLVGVVFKAGQIAVGDKVEVRIPGPPTMARSSSETQTI